MNKKIADAAAASPLTDEQRKRLNIVDAKQLNNVDNDCIAGLKCSLDSVQNQMTRIATDIQQMKEDIKGGGSFGFKDKDGYKRCRSEICCDTDMKLYTMHTCYLDCVKEMMRQYSWWREGGWITSHMDTFLQIAIDGSISSDEWLNCYKTIVSNMERDTVAACPTKRKYAIPNKIHHLAKQLSLDALLTTDEERDAGHTMVSCDLTDCHYCDEKKKKTATLLL